MEKSIHIQFKAKIFPYKIEVEITVVFQLLSQVWFFDIPELQHIRPPCPSLSLWACSNSSIELAANHLIICHLFLFLPSVFPSIRIFSSESALHISWPKHWSFSFSHNPSNVCSLLISFKIHGFDLLAVQWTLKCLLQYHTSKTSVLQWSTFFVFQLSHLYLIIGKAIALTLWTFVCKVMPLLFNMVSNFVIAFLPRTKLLLISWLRLPSAVILESKKIKSVTGSNFTTYICPRVTGPDAIILVFCTSNFKPTFSLSPFILIKRLLDPCHFLHDSSIICTSEVANILPAIVIPAYALSSPAFCMMYSSYKLNKQGDNIQPWHTPFPVLN